MIILSKDKREFRGVGFVGDLCKALARVFNQRFGVAVKFHDVLQVFRAGQGMGTVSIEDKLLQQRTRTREEVIYEIFLELLKVYDALYRYMCMDILVGFGIGPRMERIL